MKVYNDINSIHLARPAATIGIFDGVHHGHCTILSRLKRQAKEIDGETLVITFWPHPRFVLYPELAKDLRLLTTLDEKLGLLEKEVIQNVLVLPFTESFSKLSACEFVQSYLVEKLRVHSLVLGFNHRIGHDRVGDEENIRVCAGNAIPFLEKMNAYMIDGEDISSSIIRNALIHGNITKANKMLGYTYSLSGKVAGGKQLGRQIGFPTANIVPDEPLKLVPKDGVYAVMVEIADVVHKGMLNIGFRPTLDQADPVKTIEVHIFDFDEDLYNQQVKLFFIDRIRDEMRFSSVEELKNQLEKDKVVIKERLDGEEDELSLKRS